MKEKLIMIFNVLRRKGAKVIFDPEYSPKGHWRVCKTCMRAKPRKIPYCLMCGRKAVYIPWFVAMFINMKKKRQSTKDWEKWSKTVDDTLKDPRWQGMGWDGIIHGFDKVGVHYKDLPWNKE